MNREIKVKEKLLKVYGKNFKDTVHYYAHYDSKTNECTMVFGTLSLLLNQYPRLNYDSFNTLDDDVANEVWDESFCSVLE